MRPGEGRGHDEAGYVELNTRAADKKFPAGNFSRRHPSLLGIQMPKLLEPQPFTLFFKLQERRAEHLQQIRFTGPRTGMEPHGHTITVGREHA